MTPMMRQSGSCCRRSLTCEWYFSFESPFTFNPVIAGCPADVQQDISLRLRPEWSPATCAIAGHCELENVQTLLYRIGCASRELLDSLLVEVFRACKLLRLPSIHQSPQNKVLIWRPWNAGACNSSSSTFIAVSIVAIHSRVCVQLDALRACDSRLWPGTQFIAVSIARFWCALAVQRIRRCLCNYRGRFERRTACESDAEWRPPPQSKVPCQHPSTSEALSVRRPPHRT